MIRSYASGFIFTTSLPPATLAASRATVAILRSEEGIQLRREHRRRVELVRNNLIQAGLPIRRVPSHIIPVMVNNFKTIDPSRWPYSFSVMLSKSCQNLVCLCIFYSVVSSFALNIFVLEILNNYGALCCYPSGTSESSHLA